MLTFNLAFPQHMLHGHPSQEVCLEKRDLCLNKYRRCEGLSSHSLRVPEIASPLKAWRRSASQLESFTSSISNFLNKTLSSSNTYVGLNNYSSEQIWGIWSQVWAKGTILSSYDIVVFPPNNLTTRQDGRCNTARN